MIFLGEIIWKSLELVIPLYDPWHWLSGLQNNWASFCVSVSLGERSAVSVYYIDQFWSGGAVCFCLVGFTKDFWTFDFYECCMKKGKGKNSQTPIRPHVVSDWHNSFEVSAYTRYKFNCVLFYSISFILHHCNIALLSKSPDIQENHESTQLLKTTHLFHSLKKL